VTAGAPVSSPRRPRSQVYQAAQGRPASSESNGLTGKAQATVVTAAKNKTEKPISLGAWHTVAAEPTTKALEPDVVMKLLRDNDFCPGARPISFSPELGKVSSWIFKEGEHFHTRRKAATGAPVPQDCTSAGSVQQLYGLAAVFANNPQRDESKLSAVHVRVVTLRNASGSLAQLWREHGCSESAPRGTDNSPALRLSGTTEWPKVSISRVLHARLQ
jgi:hypothetical protein